MSLSDPLGDMLTRIRNAQRARHSSCVSPASQLRANVLGVLKREGFLTRDSRVVERKKYGKKKARRSFQFSKR